jgi:hypothetical protein
MSAMDADREREILFEAATSSYRERDATGRIHPSPAWFDLGPDRRDLLFEAQLELRAAERLIDADGLSATAKAVLDRLPGVRQEPRE